MTEPSFDATIKSSPVRRRWIWIVGFFALVAIGVTAWSGFRSPQDAAIQMHYAPLVRSLQFSARVAALSRVDVGATITARVAKVSVADGALVRQGDVLVQLESLELLSAVSQARANASQVQARLVGLRNTGRVAAQAALMQASATLRVANADLARSQQLVTQGFISAARLDELVRLVDVARAQQANAQAQFQANADTGTEVIQARAQLEQALAAVAAAQARFAQTQVLAPADARVLTRQVEPGQIVQPGKALMSLALAGPTQLNAQVDERFLEQLQIGQPASVVADAFVGQIFSARVLSIAPTVDAQRGAIEVKFSLDQDPPPFLREDMTLSVEVVTARIERALALPLTALRFAPGNHANSTSATVLVVQDGYVRLRSVQLGLRTLDAAQVVRGLAQGDIVLLASDLKPDQRVRVKMQVWP